MTVINMAYSKLHSSIVNSSLWTEAEAVRVLFITLLAMCDRDGVVYGTRIGLNRLANIDPEEAEVAWRILLSPDSHSSDKMRAPENEGRRIEEIPGGFKLLNFAYYRGLRNDDDRREQNRLAQAKFKSKSCHKSAKATVSQAKPPSADGSRDKPPKAHAEAEAEAEAEGGSGKEPSLPCDPKPPAPSAHTPPDSAKAAEVTNRPTLQQALKYFEASGFRVEEVRECYRQFEATVQGGFWFWGKRAVGDWRAAMEQRMHDNRDRRFGGKPATDAGESLKREIKRITKSHV